MSVLAQADDARLLTMVRDGDTGAMAQLWSRHYPAALAAARRISRQPRDAEEFASDAFAGMLQALANDAGPSSSVRGYLLTAVRNQATNKARRASAGDVLTDEITDFEDADRDPIDPVAHHAELGLVREAFATLPPRWQIVLWRTAVDHEKNTVIADELGRSPNAVAALARRARLGFRTAYLRAHSSTHGIAPECEPFVARLVELLPSSGARAEPEVRAHVEDCSRCARRLADLRVVDADLGGMLLPALLTLGPGIAWVTGAVATGSATHVAGGALWLHWGRGAGQGRKLAVIGTAAAVTVAATCSAYALTRPPSHHGPAATTRTTAPQSATSRGTHQGSTSSAQHAWTTQVRPSTGRSSAPSTTPASSSSSSATSSSAAAPSSRRSSTARPVPVGGPVRSSTTTSAAPTATHTPRPPRQTPTSTATSSPTSTATTSPRPTSTTSSTPPPSKTGTPTLPPSPLPTPTDTSSPPCWILCWIFG